MDEQLKAKLKEWAGIYNVRSFIPDDPVQFPHRFTEKRDIEISAFITSWISYGRRELILRKADWLHSRMGGSPYEWVLSGRMRHSRRIVGSHYLETVRLVSQPDCHPEYKRLLRSSFGDVPPGRRRAFHAPAACSTLGGRFYPSRSCRTDFFGTGLGCEYS